MNQETVGTELMRRINDGRIEQLPSEYLAQTRAEITAAIEELIEVGARIRPLLVGKQRVGWVRGVHLSERRSLKRWVFNEIDFIGHLLRRRPIDQSRHQTFWRASSFRRSKLLGAELLTINAVTLASAG